MQVGAPDFRPLTAGDGQLLKTATLGNLNWQVERFTQFDVETRPEFAHYARLHPARGDYGVVAEDEGANLAVAWAIFLPTTAPGYGFVDPETPELCLWVHESARRLGLGRRLLRAMQDQARQRGLSAISLSVEDRNPARRLYEQEGFSDVPGRRADGVLLWSVER